MSVKLKIFVVEDSKLFRLFLGNNLKMHDVTFVSSMKDINVLFDKLIEEGKSIEEYLNSYDVILLDYVLPDLFGPDFAEIARKTYNYHNIIIGMSNTTIQWATNLPNAINFFIYKQFMHDDLSCLPDLLLEIRSGLI